MTAAARTGAVLMIAAAMGTLSACAAGRDTSSLGTTGAGGSGAVDGGISTGSGGSTITGAAGEGGGSADAGAGDGGVFTGTGGTTGAGGATGAAGTTGAAGSAGGGGGGVPPPCRVDITADSSPDFDGLPAGPNAPPLRVRGILGGTLPPAPPVWNWTVTINPNTEAVPVTTPDPEDPSVIEFPLLRPDRTYIIAVTVSNNPLCSGMQTASTTSSPGAWYWVRIMPPPERPDLAPYDSNPIKVSAGSAGITMNDYSFADTRMATIDPMNARSETVTSYVRITSPTHSWAREGNATSLAPFRVWLANDFSSRYDVLVVPTGPNALSVAPMLYPGATADRVAALDPTVDPGISVSGTLSTQGGAPVTGATVVLRAGALPSTVGTSRTDGGFSLLARPGRFSAVILPPAGAALPEVDVDADADPTTAIDLPATGAVTLGFTWRSTISGTLAAHIVPPAAAVDVQLDSDPTSLTNVGTVQASGGPGGSVSFAAAGAVHRTGTTDSSGTVTFANVPLASYTLTAVPPVSSTNGITVSPVDLTSLTAASPSRSVTVNLAPKVTVSGTITGAPAATRVLVLDDQPAVGHVFPPMLLGSSGGFSASLDPRHAYHLLVDPPAGGATSRVPLGLVRTATTALALTGRPLPRMVPISGRVTLSDRHTTIANARVQVFCMGSGPDCIGNSQPGAKSPLPLMEAVTDATGAYSVSVPDPALPP